MPATARATDASSAATQSQADAGPVRGSSGPGAVASRAAPATATAPGGAPRVEVGDAALVPGRGAEGGRIAGEEKAQGRRAHGTAVPGIWRWSSRFQPAGTCQQASRGAARALTGADVGPGTEQLGDAGGERRGVPSGGVSDADQQLAGELGVVGVLTERIVRVGAVSGAAGEEPVAHVGFGHVGRPGFDDEAEGVAQGLPEEAAGQAVSGGEGEHRWDARRAVILSGAKEA